MQDSLFINVYFCCMTRKGGWVGCVTYLAVAKTMTLSFSRCLRSSSMLMIIKFVNPSTCFSFYPKIFNQIYEHKMVHVPLFSMVNLLVVATDISK